MNPAPGTPAVVLLSGGLDSATALAWARRDGFATHALTLDYRQRHAHELAASECVAAHLGAASHKVVRVDLRTIGGSALTSDMPVPKGRSASEIERGIPVTYVPARNLIFLSIAVGYAESLGALDIVLGINAVDYSGYPDCRPEFIGKFLGCAAAGTRAGALGKSFAVHTPLVALTKAQIIELGTRLAVDFSLTRSCYDPTPDGLACGRCDSCLIRKRGFEEAGIADPTRYASAMANAR